MTSASQLDDAQLLESTIRDSLERHLQGSDGITPARLAESMRYSLLAPGKRIRPRLVLACAGMVGLKLEAALCAAAALEMIHCFTLIHDDLPCMDDDDFRRGRPSNHKQFDEATALLAGDALIAVAVDTLLDAHAFVAPGNILAAVRRMSWAMGPRGVIGGQAAEAELMNRPDLKALTQMHRQKTGALFAASLLLPKDLAGIQGNEPKSQSIDRFADELGLAFQVMDDLDDITQDHDAKHGSPDATNILHYMPEAQARTQFTERLHQAHLGLRQAWGDAAAPLIRIGEEIASKLKS